MNIERSADIVSVAQWLALRGRQFFHFDGGGKFVRDGAYVTAAQFDDVFGKIPTDVTHAAWFKRWRQGRRAVPDRSALTSPAGRTTAKTG
jgi:hypothetical protein